MPFDPQQALRFLDTHYPAICELAELAQLGGGTLDESQLHTLQEKSLQPLPATFLLVRYGLLRKRNEGKYTLHRTYKAFLAFLSQRFALKLSARLAKYEQSFLDLSEQLEVCAQDPNQATEVAGQLCEEVGDFINHMCEDTEALRTKAEAIKHAKRKATEQHRQEQDAHRLIENYQKPLNQVLNTGHHRAIYMILRNIRANASAKVLALAPLGDKQRDAYGQLIGWVDDAMHQLEQSNAITIGEIGPLLEQIKIRNQAFTGLYYLCTNYRRHKQEVYIFFLPKCLEVTRRKVVHHPYFVAQAKAFLAAWLPTEAITMPRNPPLPTYWIFDPTHYKAKLMQHLPIDHFIPWCFARLQEARQGAVPTHAQLIKVVNLMFSPEVSYALDLSLPRKTLTLKHSKLRFPKITLTLRHGNN